MTDVLENTVLKEYEEFDNMPIFEGKAGMKLLAGISAYGFEHPSPIQKKAIMEIAQGHDLIAQARSGTGKTGAFVIGTLARIDYDDLNVQALIFAHTHELASQIYDVVLKIGERLNIKAELCIGQQISPEENMRNLREGRHICIGTPGRIQDLIRRKHIVASKVKIVIVDEADKLLADKFKEQIREIVSTIIDENATMQMAIFSATMTRDLVDLARDRILNNPSIILVPQEHLTLDGIEQYRVDLNPDKGQIFSTKVDFIMALNQIKVIPQCIIYVNGRASAEELSSALNHAGLQTICIHGNMGSRERRDVVNSFRTGQQRILISTDLLSRGFDVQQVSLVINFELPMVTNKNTGYVDETRVAEYLHRIGRSGRFGRKGVAINIIATVSEQDRLHTIEKHYGIEIKALPAEITDII